MPGLLKGLVHPVVNWANATLSFVYPEVCELCGGNRATPGQGYVCDDCRNEVGFIEPPFCCRCGRPVAGEVLREFECGNCRGAELHFLYARSVARASGKLLQAIHAFKYDSRLWLEPFLADVFVTGAQPVLAAESWDVIVPVPLHRSKQRKRGFNQAEHLARHLSRALSLPLRNTLVKRVVPTPTQTRLTRAERLENMRGAFRVPKVMRLNGERIILVDDVFTTGATTSACAKALLKAGAGEVCVWTVARGI